MSASKMVTIFCDAPSCGWWEEVGTGNTAKEARQRIKNTWLVAQPGGFDYCPEHKER